MPRRRSWGSLGTAATLALVACASPAERPRFVAPDGSSAEDGATESSPDATPVDPGLRFVPMVPGRLLDSRLGDGPISAGMSRSLSVAGALEVPATARAVALSVVAITTGAGDLRVGPKGAGLPAVAAVQTPTAGTRSGAIVSPLAGGEVDLHAVGTALDVVVDVTGWFEDAGTRAGGFFPLTPALVYDTAAATPLEAGVTRTFVVTGAGGVPASGVSAALLMVEYEPSANAFLAAWSTDHTRPTTSAIHAAANSPALSLISVGVGADGAVAVRTSGGAASVKAHVVGYWASAASTQYVAVRPFRALDTRQGDGAAPIGAGAHRDVVLAGSSVLPSAALLEGVAVHVTATGPTLTGFLQAVPAADGAPTRSTSTVNFEAGETVANHVLVGVGDDGDLRVVNSAGTAHAIVDVVGYFLKP